MKIACLFGKHDWAGCKCTRCDKTRDQSHDWSNDCEKCSRCGSTRAEAHDWKNNCEHCNRCGTNRKNFHLWAGCNCKTCGQARDHSWSGCKCKNCGKTRDQEHQWEGCKCMVCGSVRDEEHDWNKGSNLCRRCGANRDDNLVAAARDGQTKIVRSLLDKGADVNAKNNVGSSALTMAAIGGHEDVLRELLKHGANVQAQNRDGVNALYGACQGGHAAIVNELLKHDIDVNAQTCSGATALIIAVINKHMEIVRVLLEHGADTQKKTQEGATVLSHCISEGDVEMARTLLEHGADANEKWDKDMSPLMLAAAKGLTPLVELLLRKGANVNAQRIGGGTPLLDAAFGGRTGILSLLIENGANVNSKFTSNGGTALMFSSQKGHAEAVKLLLAKGADPTMKASGGETALSLATQFGHAEIIKLLSDPPRKELPRPSTSELGAPKKTPRAPSDPFVLHKAAQQGDVATVREANQVESGIPFGMFFFNSSDKGISGNYALHAKKAVSVRVAEQAPMILDAKWEVLSGDLFDSERVKDLLDNSDLKPDLSLLDANLKSCFTKGRSPDYIVYLIGMFMCPSPALRHADTRLKNDKCAGYLGLATFSLPKQDAIVKIGMGLSLSMTSMHSVRG